MSKDRTQQEIASQVEAETCDATPEKRARKRGKYFTAAMIAKTATFVAIAIVCKLIGKTLMLTPSFTISFIYLPWLIAGASLGPVGGMTVGLLSDVLGNLIFGTPLNPLTVVSNTLFPLPIALMFALSKRGNVYVKTVCGALASLALCTLGIGSFALYWYYGYIETMNFFAYVALYRLPQVGVLAVNIVAMCLLVRPLQKAGLYLEQEKAEGGRLAFALGLVVAYALFAAALITVTASGMGNAPTYIILSAIYLLFDLFMISARAEGGVKTALIVGEVLTALVMILTLTISGGITLWLKYTLSAAAVAAAAGITAVVLVRRSRARRKNI